MTPRDVVQWQEEEDNNNNNNNKISYDSFLEQQLISELYFFRQELKKTQWTLSDWKALINTGIVLCEVRSKPGFMRIYLGWK